MPVTLVHPLNESRAAARTAAGRIASLEGKTVALLDISKGGGNHFLDRLEELLRDRYKAARVDRHRKPTFAKQAPPGMLDQLQADAVIEALAD